MLRLKSIPKEELDLPLRRLTVGNDRTKSTFIDPFRIDTVRRPVPSDLSLDDFITSKFFIIWFLEELMKRVWVKTEFFYYRKIWVTVKHHI